MADSSIVIARAVPIIRSFEHFSPTPYLCPAGRPTIGYGATHYESGKPVTLADPAITLAHAGQLLQDECFSILQKMQPGFTHEPTANQAAAMLSFTYNVGIGAFLSSALLIKFNAQNLMAAANQFLAWDKATVGGKKVSLKGLSVRRAAERELFLEES
jgi:lysozyme